MWRHEEKPPRVRDTVRWCVSLVCVCGSCLLLAGCDLGLENPSGPSTTHDEDVGGYDADVGGHDEDVGGYETWDCNVTLVSDDVQYGNEGVILEWAFTQRCRSDNTFTEVKISYSIVDESGQVLPSARGRTSVNLERDGQTNSVSTYVTVNWPPTVTIEVRSQWRACPQSVPHGQRCDFPAYP